MKFLIGLFAFLGSALTATAIESAFAGRPIGAAVSGAWAAIAVAMCVSWIRKYKQQKNGADT